MKMPAFIKGKAFKICLKLLTVFFCLLALHLLLGRPAVKRVEAARERSISLQKKLEDIQRIIRENPDPKQKIEEIKKKREEFQTKANASNELPRIIQQLTQKSSELKIEIVSIRQIKEAPPGGLILPEGVDKAYLEVVLKAPYSVVGEYLKAIGSLPSLCTVESIVLRRIDDEAKAQPVKKDEKEENIIATLVIGTYTVWRIM